MLLVKAGCGISPWVIYSALSLKCFYWLCVNSVCALLAVYFKLFVPASIKKLDCRNKLVSPCKRLSECHSFRFVACKSRGENPQHIGSSKKQESSRGKIKSNSALLTMPKPLTVCMTINLENSERDVNARPPDLTLEKSVRRSRSIN